MAVSTFSSHLRKVLANDLSRNDLPLLKVDRAVAVESAPHSLFHYTNLISKNILTVLSTGQFKRDCELPIGAHVITDVNDQELVSLALKAAEAKARCLIVTRALKFKTLDEMMDAEDELANICNSSGLKILGPDSFGLYSEGHNLTAFPEIEEGSVALISQSKSVAELLLSHGKSFGFGFSFAAGIGQQFNLSVTDTLTYLLRRELPAAVLMYLETISNAADFIKVASKISRKTPMIALIGGRSETGARVAASHTNSLVVDDGLMQAVLSRAGILPVRDLREALDVTRCVVHGGVPKGKRVAVISHSGGINALMADHLEAEGRQIPVFPAELQERLKRELGAYVSTVNPIDAGQNGQQLKALKLVLASDQVNAVVVCNPTASGIDSDSRRSIEAIATKHQQSVFYYTPLDARPPEDGLTFSSMTQLARCLKLLDQLGSERPVANKTSKVSEARYAELQQTVKALIKELPEDDYQANQNLLTAMNISCGSGFYAGNYPNQLALSLSNEVGFGRVLTVEFKGQVTHAVEPFDDAVIDELIGAIPNISAATRIELTELAKKLVWVSLFWKDLALFSCDSVLFGRDGILVTDCKIETF